VKRRIFITLLVLALILLALPGFAVKGFRRVTRAMTPRPAGT